MAWRILRARDSTGSSVPTPADAFSAALGLELPPALASLIDDRSPDQREQIALLDVDVLIFQASSEAERQALEQSPLFRNLRVAGGPDDLSAIHRRALRGAEL